MKRKEVFYAVIGGCVGAVLTMAMSTFSPLGAQSRSDGKFNTITCRELRVMNPDGGIAAVVSGGNHSDSGGVVALFGTDGKPRVSMFVDANGGFILLEAGIFT